MKKFLPLLLVVMALACGKTKTSEQDTTQMTFSELLDTYYEEKLKLNPLEATLRADYRYNSELPNTLSKAYEDMVEHFLLDMLNALSAFQREDLSETDRISYDAMKWEIERGLEASKFSMRLIPFQQFWGLPLDLPQYGSGQGGHPFRNEQDYRDFMQRLEKFTIWMDTAIVNFREGIARGIVLPRAVVVKMIPQMQDLGSDHVENVFLGPLKNIPGEVQNPILLKEEYEQLLRTRVFPSYRNMAHFLENEYLPAARESSGIGALPDGNEQYAYWVRYWTTTDMTPDEIFQTGLKEVVRLREEMETVKEQLGFKGDLQAFFKYINSDKRFFPFKTEQEVLDAFRKIEATIQPKLDEYFTTRPRAAFEIRQTEKFREASASAEYMPAAPDGSRPGIFYVPIPDARKFNLASGMESLFLHEAIPGHHFQFCLQQENEALPKFRRYGWYGAYGEGWALYCESLGKELGLYTDPIQYMGALGDEMHRAIRLVVDVGLHQQGWTREEAIEYMMDNMQMSEAGAIAEIERYMVIPAQALSYKIGALKIRELREKYQHVLGEKFSIAEFHHQILVDGGMPLSVLEAKLEDWAKTKEAMDE
jgi:uncharacterized protein (DUF885 family)